MHIIVHSVAFPRNICVSVLLLRKLNLVSEECEQYGKKIAQISKECNQYTDKISLRDGGRGRVGDKKCVGVGLTK